MYFCLISFKVQVKVQTKLLWVCDRSENKCSLMKKWLQAADEVFTTQNQTKMILQQYELFLSFSLMSLSSI